MIKDTYKFPILEQDNLFNATGFPNGFDDSWASHFSINIIFHSQTYPL